MNKKAWCAIGMIAVFVVTSILVAEFSWPWLTVLGFIVYTVFGYGVYDGMLDEDELEYQDMLLFVNKEKNELMNKYMSLEQQFNDTQKELDELKLKYKDLEDLKKLNEQPKPKKSKKKEEK